MTPTAFAGYALSDQQRAFFTTFGFLKVKGLFADEVDAIRAGFEEVFANEQPLVLSPENRFHHARDPEYRAQPRLYIPFFASKSEKLRWLLEDPRVHAVPRALLEGDYKYTESDGNLFNCDVYWHLDAFGVVNARPHVKLYFYLDPLGRDSGALQMIPGTHLGGPYTKALRKYLAVDPTRAHSVLGVEQDQIPSCAIDVEPGDLVVGDFRTLHGSFNGAARRRLFTINFTQTS